MHEVSIEKFSEKLSSYFPIFPDFLVIFSLLCRVFLTQKYLNSSQVLSTFTLTPPLNNHVKEDQQTGHNLAHFDV